MIKVRLKPKQGIKVVLKTVYLYDETLVSDQVNKAKEWAIKTDGKVKEDGVDIDYSSKYYAGLSKESEQNAKTSELNALESVEEVKRIKDTLGRVYVFRGSVETFYNLPIDAKAGDVYDVLDGGINYAWTGDRWDSLGSSFDFSEYAKKEYVDTKEQEIIQNFMDADKALQTQITENVRSDFAEADNQLQIQINGQATLISDLSDDVMNNMSEIANLKTIPHIIDTYVNGTSGYRVWSDGYCEQWGYLYPSNKNVELLKKYRDINYNLLHANVSVQNSSQNNGAYSQGGIVNESTIFLRAHLHGTSFDEPISWKTSGYLASGQY